VAAVTTFHHDALPLEAHATMTMMTITLITAHQVLAMPELEAPHQDAEATTTTMITILKMPAAHAVKSDASLLSKKHLKTSGLVVQ
jgi:hypothetical protein